MTERDIPQILNLSRDYPETAWSESLFIKEIYNPNSIAIVAELDNQVIGYLCARVVIDECHLQNIAVKADYRGRGIAIALMQELINRLDSFNAAKIFLELRQSNERALNLYKKMGFNIIALRKNYYYNPSEDGLMMLKTINPRNAIASQQQEGKCP